MTYAETSNNKAGLGVKWFDMPWLAAKHADLQNGPTNGDVVNIPPTNKLLTLASPSRHLIQTKREGVFVKSERAGALKPDSHDSSVMGMPIYLDKINIIYCASQKPRKCDSLIGKNRRHSC